MAALKVLLRFLILVAACEWLFILVAIDEPAWSWVHGFANSIPPTPVAACNLTTGVVTGVGAGGAGTCNGAAGAVCNGVANDNATFVAFNTWANTWQGSHSGLIELDISGNCVNLTTIGGSLAFLLGIKQVQVVGFGATIGDGNGVGVGFFFGCQCGQQNGAVGVHDVRIATVASGSTTLTVSDTSKCSLWSAGNWALVTGLDIQGAGQPSNPAFFDYVQITSTASCAGTGQISFTPALTYQYKSTWPVYNSGGAGSIDQGGPATLYQLDPNWDTSIAYYGVTINQVGQQTMAARSVAFYDVTATASGCVVPSANLNYLWHGGSLAGCDLEIDKLITAATFENVTINQMVIQSPEPQLLTLNSVTLTSGLQGTPVKTVINNSNISQLSFGTQAYGVAGSVAVNNSIVSSVGVISYKINNINTLGTWASNTFASTDSMNGVQGWAVPGANFYFAGSSSYAPLLQVADVAQSGGVTSVTFNQNGSPYSFSSFPTTPGTALQPVAAPKVTFINVTGSVEAVDLSNAGAQGQPLGNYSLRTLTAANCAPTTAVVPMLGLLTSVKVNVTVASNAAGSIGINLNSPFIQQFGSSNGSIAWNPTVNAKLTGLRTILPTSASGAQSGDSLALPSPGVNTWLLNNQISPQCSAAPAGGDPITATVEIIANQGVVYPAP